MGIKREKTARQPRNTRQEQERRTRREEGRQRREGHGWPRAWGAEERNGEENGSRGTEQGENEKEIYKYLRERREKNAAETRKSAQVCVYTYHPISRRGGCLLHFLLYIRGILYIFIYILSRLMFTFLLKLMFVLDIHYYI